MTLAAADMRSRLRALFEAWLPWFDRREADAANQRTEDIRVRSITSRQRAEMERERLTVAVRDVRQRIREDYRLQDERLAGRR
jgi:hypothetical protein